MQYIRFVTIPFEDYSDSESRPPYFPNSTACGYRIKRGVKSFTLLIHHDNTPVGFIMQSFLKKELEVPTMIVVVAATK